MPIPRLAEPVERPLPTPTPSSKPRKPWRYRWGLLLALLVLSVGAWGTAWLSSVALSFTSAGKSTSVLQQLGRLIGARDKQVSGESRDRINILLLGIGGPGHEGPLLTDTMLLASIKPSTKEVALLSIPRDLAVQIPQYGIRKINNAVAFGNDLKYPGGGEQLSADIVAEVTGEPVDYYARVDFAAFKDIVDALGGVDVNVDRSFVDADYPNLNYGYQTVRFLAGPQTMSGALALEFARSRHGTNGEGSDFARAARQQKLLIAIRRKALSVGTLLNPGKLLAVSNAFSSHVRTDLEPWEIVRLAQLAKDVPTGSIVTRVLDSSANSPLKVATGTDGAFLLVPRAGLEDWSDVRSIAQNIFSVGRIESEKASVVVLNNTGTKGLAESEGHSLAILNFNVVRTATGTVAAGAGTNIIVDYSGGAKPYTITALTERYGAVVTTAAPAFVDPATREYKAVGAPGDTARADILILLGKSSKTTSPQPSVL